MSYDISKTSAAKLLNMALSEHDAEIRKIIKEDRFFILPATVPHAYHLQGVNAGIIASFSLQQLPGCCGVVVSFHSSIQPPYRKKGLGTILAKARMAAARGLGYGQMVATVVSGNDAEEKILTSLGWKQVMESRNPKTGHVIHTWSVVLK